MSEWDLRQLCPEGSCIGVIGPDGTCKTCGRAAPNWGDERRRGLDETPLPPPFPGDDDEPVAAVHAATDDEGDAPSVEDSDSDEDDRRLCPDGACVGLIGPDDRCKVCGKAAE